jgi:probable O-glycosylation ligase (exosortase A-associated)
MAVIGLSAAAALSSWSRGALITLVVTAGALLWHSKRKYMMVPLLIAGVALALVSLPESWIERMQSTASYEQDESAQSRLNVWRVGIKHALAFPMTGVGLDGWHYAVVTGDWHNSYVEMMAEHGFIAFALWCLLIFGTVISLMRLARVGARSPDLAWVRNYSQMLGASLIAYAIGSMFLGLSYWDILYHIIVIAVLLSEIARKAGIEAARLERHSPAVDASATAAP